MIITRRQSLGIGLGTIALFFCISFIMLYRAGSVDVVTDPKPDVQPTDSLQSSEPPKFDPEVPVTLSKFHRSEVKDGKKLWEITADSGKYSPKTSNAELIAPNVSLFQKDGATVTLTAQKALVHIKGTELDRAESTGNVVLNYNDKVILTTDAATYDRAADTVLAPGAVAIDNEGVQITGNDLRVNVEKREFELRSNVSTEIRPRKKKS